jgi:hypothetical protein
MSEDLGDDPVKGGDYGIANLKYILSNLEGWIPDDADYRHRKTLYDQIAEQYQYYIRNVTTNIGGIGLYQVKQGTPGERIVPVAREVQKRSLHWVMEQYRDMEWLNAPSLKRSFPLSVDGSAALRSGMLTGIVGRIPYVVLSSHYSTSPYTVREFLNDLYDETWKHARMRRHLTDDEKYLQKTMVEVFCRALATAGGSDEETIAVTTGTGAGERDFGPAGMGIQPEVDVSGIDDSNEYLTDLAIRSRDLLRRRLLHRHRVDRAHYQSLLIKLNSALKDKL